MPKPQSTPSTTQQRKKCSAIFIENPKKSNHQNANFDRQKFQRQFFFPKQSPGVAPFFVICVTLLG
jgi:hypothetical protein